MTQSKPAAKVNVVPKIWRFLRQSDARINILYGSAGSGKSVGITQNLLFNCFYNLDGVRLLVVRKTLPSLRTSCMQLILDQLSDYNLPYEFNKSNLIISNGTNQLLFRSLDDVDKLKSIEGITHVWVEEATEISKNDYMQLNIRMRGVARGVKNQMYLSFNPSDANSWLKPLTEVPTEDMSVCHSTFRDNPYLDPLYVAELEKLIDIDPTYHAIYNLGQWATPTNIIYNNWDIVLDSEWPVIFDEERYGLDFGFASSETALVHIRRVGDELYIRQLVYSKKLTTLDLIAEMDKYINKAESVRIIADSARPEDIEEIYRHGYNIHPCIKGAGSVKTGINRVKQFKIHILESAVDVGTEIKGYKWKEDKDGNILDKPVEFRDHTMDAIRYPVADMAWTKPDYNYTGTLSDIRRQQAKEAVSESPEIQNMINTLATGAPDAIVLICQSIVRNPNEQVIKALKFNSENHSDAEVRMRCNEMLEILQTKGIM